MNKNIIIKISKISVLFLFFVILLIYKKTIISFYTSYSITIFNIPKNKHSREGKRLHKYSIIYYQV